MIYSKRGFLQANAATIFLMQQLLDPVLAVGLLFWLNRCYEVAIDPPYIILAVLTGLAMPVVFRSTGLYQSFRGQSPTSEGPRIFLGWVILLGVLFFLGYLTKSSEIFSRSVILTWTVAVPSVLSLTHLMIRIGLQQLRASGFNSRKVVIAGTNELACHLAEQIYQTPALGLRFCGFFMEPQLVGTGKVQVTPLIGTLEELPDYVRRYDIDVVYIALSVEQHEMITTLINGLQDTTACVYFVPNIFLFNLMQASPSEINGIPLVTVWEVPFSQAQYLLKRLIDVWVASLALLLLSPVMITIAIAVKLSSPGPILFKQRRYGLNGKEIVVYKFRSMRVQEDGARIIQAKQHDPRVTRVGAFIRRTSLDELPQFINVLQGRMSVVGPRPHAIAHNEQYRKLIRGYMLRHKVRPGITGWAQIHGLRGETDTLDKMERRVAYDLEYLNNWSLWLDLQIILRTITVFFTGKNAY